MIDQMFLSKSQFLVSDDYPFRAEPVVDCGCDSEGNRILVSETSSFRLSRRQARNVRDSLEDATNLRLSRLKGYRRTLRNALRGADYELEGVLLDKAMA